MLVRTWLLVAVVAAVPLLAQDPPPPHPDAAAIQEAIEGFRKAHKEKLEQDQIHFVKLLADKWAGADEKQRKEIFDLCDKNLKGRSQPVKDATVEALPKMNGGDKDKDAETATKLLVDERGRKTTEENAQHFGNVCRALGKLHHPKGMPVLLKLLNYKDFDIIAAAAEGLSGYREAGLEVKREIVGELLKTYTSAWNAVANNPRDNNLKDRLKKVQSSMEAALKSLTGQQGIEGADKWWKWWNDTGKKAKAW